MKFEFSKQVLFLVLMAGTFSLLTAPAVAAGHGHGDGVEKAVQSQSLDRTVLTYHLGEFAHQKVTVGDRDYLAPALEHRGFVQMDKSGHPQLPALCESLIIPDTARMEINVLDSCYHEIEGVEILPWRGPIPRSVDPSTVEYTFGDVYEKDEWFPGDLASLRDPYILHDVRGVVVDVFPFQYNPVKKILRVYHEIEVEVAAAEPGRINTIDRSTFGYKPSRAFRALYMSRFANFSSGRTEPPTESGDLLIISHGAFMSAMQPLIDWKTSIGINTTIVDVATIGNNSTAIKNYITTQYNLGNLAFVLLVGDASQVASGYYSYGVSDPDYACITADWYPDIFVGRFSAETTAHVDTQVQRTIEYEQEGHDVTMGGWNAKGMGIASSEGSGYGHYGEGDWEHADLIRDELLAVGFTDVDQIYEPNGTAAQVSAGLNDGRRIVNYTGHGWSQGWGTTGFSNSHVNALTNVGMLPFICSVACNGGDFDYGTCFGEAWLRATHNGEPTGAIASYNSSIGQSWAEPMYGQGNHAYNNQYGAADRFWMEINETICGIWFGGSCTMMDICGSYGREMFMTWICFGDPSLRVVGAGHQVLTADGDSIPISTPVAITFTISHGATHTGYDYFLAGGASGTDPGTTTPYGLHVPINADWFTQLIFNYLNTPLFDDFWGSLDSQGEGTPTLNTSGVVPINPGLVGTTLSFCAIVGPPGAPFDEASNVVELVIVN